MEEFLREWGYLGVFLGILSTGIPFVPIPEELPVVVGGVLVGNGTVTWWMLPVCIVAVVIGDSMLYGVGRWSGPRLLENSWIKKHVLPPERRQKIEENFHKHGIKILLFARLTPGIRAPIFVMAGITRLSLPRFIMADGLYAIPGVSLLFILGWYFTDSIVSIIEKDFEVVKRIIILVIALAVAGYILYRFLRRPIVTGDPKEMPPIMEHVTHRIEHTLGELSTIIHPKSRHAPPTTNAPPTMKMMPPGETQAVDGQAGAAEKKAEDRRPSS